MVGYLLKKNKRFSVLFFIFSLMFLTQNVSRVLGDESEAVSWISQAENSLEAAYLSILEAERVGGDVSEIIAFLNTALEYYSEAERALESEEYDIAVQLAGKVVEASNAVLEADSSLIVVAGHVEEEAFRNQLFLSFGAVCFIVLFGFLGWRLFKGYYARRMIGLRSEVFDIGSR
jgi:hypothetical protein